MSVLMTLKYPLAEHPTMDQIGSIPHDLYSEFMADILHECQIAPKPTASDFSRDPELRHRSLERLLGAFPVPTKEALDRLRKRIYNLDEDL